MPQFPWIDGMPQKHGQDRDRRAKRKAQSVSGKKAYDTWARQATADAVGQIIRAVTEMPDMAGELLAAVSWIALIGKRKPRTLKIVAYCLSEWGGCPPQNATAILAQELGVSRRTVNTALRFIATDNYLRHLVLWRPQKCEFV